MNTLHDYMSFPSNTSTFNHHTPISNAKTVIPQLTSAIPGNDHKWNEMCRWNDNAISGSAPIVVVYCGIHALHAVADGIYLHSVIITFIIDSIEYPN